MKRSRFNDGQIFAILKEQEAGLVFNLCDTSAILRYPRVVIRLAPP
jgi:hypothetical protein